LQQKTHGTLLEINLDALLHNLNYYRSKLKPGTKIMVMVKAFAYGSGSIEVANLLQFHRVDYLAVAYTDEGVFLRENGIHLPIMVMNPSVHTFDKLLAYQLEPQLYSKSILQEFLTYLEETDRQARIHLKLDTGMHRLGFEPHELSWLTEVLHQQSRITLASIFSHLAAADENNWDSFSREQISQFISMADQIESVLDYKPIRHILNTAGIARFPDDQMEMVRLGIGLYGVGINAKEAANLETVGTLKTTISQIKHIKASDTVGYGRKGKLNKDTTLATIAIGYADGFDRRLSNGVGKVWVNGGLAPVVGNVCMDMTMIDITGIKAKEGDEVIIFGKENPISELAISMSTIPYEILTGVGERVKRVFFAS
jgi:alanine racemase